MSKHAARGRSGEDRPSLYQEITEKIVVELEAGRVPEPIEMRAPLWQFSGLEPLQ
jgi:antirestriction protein ArdC